MSVVEHILRLVMNFFMALAGVIALVMMLHVTADFSSRFLLGRSLDGTLEIVAAYYMVAVIFLPLAYVQATGSHIVVELFTQWMRGRPLWLLEGFAGAATLTYLGLLVWQTLVEAMNRTAEGEVWETGALFLPVWQSRWMLPVGCALMAAAVLLKIVHDLLRAHAMRADE